MTVALIIAGAVAADLLFAVCVGKWLKGPCEPAPVSPLVGGWKP